MQLQPGTLLQGDRYRIIDVLGQGGFGITYLAEQVMAERKVCIKEFFPKEYYNRNEDSRSISLGTQGSAEIMELYKAKFIKEAKTIAKLDHPNIIHIHDVFAENNTAYYVMEYIDGESLSALVKERGALAESEAISYIKQVAAALGSIHEQRIMHLDIKPANIMIHKNDGKPVLIDFGLSKQYDAEGNQTSSTPVGISAGYAPMEQYQQGGVREFSPETDIYSLGATLYYLVTGEVPPQAASVVDNGLPKLPAHLSSGVRNAIERSMELQRKKRPHSIKEFLSLLEDNNPIVVPIPTPASAPVSATADDKTSVAASAPMTDDRKVGSTPAPMAQPTPQPKKEWVPKYAVDKPKKSNSEDEKSKSKRRLLLWLFIAIAVVIVGVVIGLGGSGDDAESKQKDVNDTSAYNNTSKTPVTTENADSNLDALVQPYEATVKDTSHQELDIMARTDQTEPEKPKKEQKKVQTKVPTDALTIVSNDTQIETPDLMFTEDASEFDNFDFDMDVVEEEIDEGEEIFTVLEDPATFQGGGIAEFRTWVMSNMIYPQIALENGIQGNVIIEFVVDENGWINNIKVLQSPDPVLSDAVISVCHKAPKWKPGKQRGKAVKQKFVLPVSFKIQN